MEYLSPGFAASTYSKHFNVSDTQPLKMLGNKALVMHLKMIFRSFFSPLPCCRVDEEASFTTLTEHFILVKVIVANIGHLTLFITMPFKCSEYLHNIIDKCLKTIWLS